MKAIQVAAPGGPEAMTLVDVSEPREHPDRILVHVEAIGVNFIDTYHRSGRYAMPLPFTPGMEGAGTVVHVGDNVDSIDVGDRVAWAFTQGSYSTMVSLPPADCYLLPDNVDTRTGAAVMLQGLTAHMLTHSVRALAPGDIALVHAAAGGVGQLLVQMARIKGARVIATVGSEAKASVARKLGAQDVIRYDQFDHMETDLPQAVKALTLDAGVHVVYDGVGAATFDGSLDSLRPRGTLALFGQASGPVAPVDPQRLNAAGSVYLTRPSLGHFVADPAERAERARDLFTMLTKGQLSVTVGDTFPLADAAKAHQALESRSTMGKVLLLP